MSYFEDVGRYVRVRLHESDEVIEGWLRGRSGVGVYVALAPDGKAIRFVPHGEWQDIEYSGWPPPPFLSLVDAEDYRELARAIEGPMSDALDRVDFNRVKRTARPLVAAYWRLHELERGGYGRHVERHGFDPYRVLEILMSIRDAHRALLDEVSHAGVLGVLRKHRARIRQVASLDTLPQLDGAVMSRREINSMLKLAKENDALSETDDGWKYLDRLSAEQTVHFFSIEEAHAEPEHKGEDMPPSQPEPPDLRKARRLRKGAAWMKVAGGGALAAANVATGTLVGVVSALPSLGIGAVAAAVGIATSAYTGLNAASDGLKDLATAIEGNK